MEILKTGEMKVKRQYRSAFAIIGELGKCETVTEAMVLASRAVATFLAGKYQGNTEGLREATETMVSLLVEDLDIAAEAMESAEGRRVVS